MLNETAQVRLHLGVSSATPNFRSNCVQKHSFALSGLCDFHVSPGARALGYIPRRSRLRTDARLICSRMRGFRRRDLRVRDGAPNDDVSSACGDRLRGGLHPA